MSKEGVHEKSGAPAFLSSPRCGAKTRKGTPCRAPAMPNGRCKLHGGKSTGPKTEEGRRRCAEARYVHGLYTKEAKQMNSLIKSLLEIHTSICANARESVEAEE